MKRHGFINLYLVVGVMLFSIIIIAIFGYPLVNSYFRATKAVNLIEPYVESRNGLERLYGKFFENISYNEITEYPDLHKNYQIIDKDIQMRDINLSLSGSGSKIFKVLNKTDINIYINYYSTAIEDEPSYYNIKLLFGGNSIYENSNISTGKSITIPNKFLYDETIGNFNYGDYTLVISTVNANVNATISYEEQFYRKVDIIENDDIKRTLVIENNTSIDGTITRYLVED